MIGWDDLTTQILSQEKTLQDFIYSYWYRFSFHLEHSCNRSGFFLTGTGTGRKGQTGPGRPVYRHD